MIDGPITACPGCGVESSEDYDGEGRCLKCHQQQLAVRSLLVEVASIEEFAAIDEAGAEALLGDADANLIPQGSDVMFYGDGGAGKTSLTIDLGCHLGSGKNWLGLPVRQPVRVLMIEAEGPRPLLRRKLRRKLEVWDGPDLAGRVRILTSPWASFTFATEEWRTALAKVIDEQQIDVVIAGPLTRIGMDTAGTLQEIVSFMGLVGDVRHRCSRLLTLILVHHESKAGAVSGAWEGAGDTLLHVRAAGPGQTVVHVQKARWSSEHHGKTLRLTWTPGEGFELVGERDYLAAVTNLLADGEWRTKTEIREAVGAGTQTVDDLLEEHCDHFQMRTGEDARALGRSAKAQLFQVAE